MDDTSSDESTNDSEGGHEAEPEEEDEPAPEPSAAVRDLKETLADRGMTVEIEADKQIITAEKLGERYRLKPGEVLDGDGRYREKLEQIVAET